MNYLDLLEQIDSVARETEAVENMKGRHEFCCNCDDETGRGEDSIYATLIRDWHWIRGIRTEVFTEAGDEVGPLCESCYQKMRGDGYFAIAEPKEQTK